MNDLIRCNNCFTLFNDEDLKLLNQDKEHFKVCPYCKTDAYLMDIKDVINNSFINDKEKMDDLKLLTKDEFLKSYSYITEWEYDNTLYLNEHLNIGE